MSNPQQQQQQQQCFESSPHGHSQLIIQPARDHILGQAKPLYQKRQNATNYVNEQNITLKLVPCLQRNDVDSYVPFRLGGLHAENGRNDQVSRRKDVQQLEANDEEEMMIEYKNKLKKINAISKNISIFSVFYEKNDLIYTKFDNRRNNCYKGISYFAGMFVPISVLLNKLKYMKNNENAKNTYNIGPLVNQNKIKKNNIAKITNTTNDDTMLTFESNFQSGNLLYAYRSALNTYDLILNNDTNSKGSTQWFYFSIKGIQANVDYVFNIVNLTKNDSLFNYGMKPVLYSLSENSGIKPQNMLPQRQKQCKHPGWYRYGKNVKYFKNKIQRQGSTKYYYTLTFVINWKVSKDTLYLAHSYPYTYTRIQNIMRGVSDQGTKSTYDQKNNNKNRIFVQLIKIGKSIANLQLTAYLIQNKKSSFTITSKTRVKQAIIFMARQHPGQTQGSFVCQGIISKLINNSSNEKNKQVTFLLQNYHVYVIPMLNPDGVVFGHYRTNLSGKDLNRKWDIEGDNALFVPEVVAVKKFISQLKNKGISLRFILDLHGHSKKLNSFFYGNPSPQNPLSTKIFPYICSRYSQAIQYLDCTFSQQQYKKKAARVYLNQINQQMQIYTFQSSFYAYRNRAGKLVEFTPAQYMKLGQVLIQSLYVLLVKQRMTKNSINKINQQSISAQTLMSSYIKQAQTCANFQQELKQDNLLLKVGDICSSGSESKPQQGQLDNRQIAFQSQQQQQDDKRVIVSSKIVNKSHCEQTNAGGNDAKIQISKSKSIRISSRKTIPQNLIQYKDLNKCRNKKSITISQVNGVLADKYQISLVPIERSVYRTGKKIDGEVQTQKLEKIVIRQFKMYQIQEREHLVGWAEMKNNELDKFRDNSMSTSLKRHSQIVAQIQKNSRHQIYKQNHEFQRSNINTRKPRQQPKQKQKNKRSIFTQTLVTFKNYSIKQKQLQKERQKQRERPYISAIDQSINGIKRQPFIPNIPTQNDARIAKMEKINKQVLKVYSRKSAIIDIGLKIKKQEIVEKRFSIPHEEKLIRIYPK